MAPGPDQPTTDEQAPVVADGGAEGGSTPYDSLRDALAPPQEDENSGDDELAEASAEGGSAEVLSAPGPLRPAQGATNPKVAGPPPVADQPGLGRAANPERIPGPRPNLSVTRVGAEVDRRRKRAAEHRRMLASRDEG